MKKVIRKGMIIIGVYLIFTLYLFAASARIERLEDNSELEKVRTVINIGDQIVIYVILVAGDKNEKDNFSRW